MDYFSSQTPGALRRLGGNLQGCGYSFSMVVFCGKANKWNVQRFVVVMYAKQWGLKLEGTHCVYSKVWNSPRTQQYASLFHKQTFNRGHGLCNAQSIGIRTVGNVQVSRHSTTNDHFLPQAKISPVQICPLSH